MVHSVNEILQNKTINRDSCKIILDFDKNVIDNKNNRFFNEQDYNITRKDCDSKYNIENIVLKEDICKEIIK